MSGAGARSIDSALDCAHALVTAAQCRTAHGRGSPVARRALHDFVALLVERQRQGCEPLLALQFDDDAICHDGEALLAPSLQAKALLRALSRREVAAITFLRGADAEECEGLFDLLLQDENQDALRRPHRDQALAAFGVRRIKISSRSPADPSDRRRAVADDERQDLRQYQDLAQALHESSAAAARDRSFAVASTQTAIESAVLRLEQAPSGLLALASHDDVDRFTVGHSVRVALLALQVARALGTSRDQLVDIGAAALLHDIGKSKVPTEILFKQGRLEEGEWVWMAQHPRLGADILLEQQDLLPSAIGAAFCHHMDGCGGGYPSTILPVEPSATSKLVRVCDVFEALTSVRPYKKALTPLEAYAVMRRHEGDFDPRWFRLFVRTLGIFPVGSRVLLDDGALAVVTEQGRTPAEPVVRLLSGPGGADLPAGAEDRVVIGALVRGQRRTIRSFCAHKRTVAVPEAAWAPLDYLTQTVHGSCLRRESR